MIYITQLIYINPGKEHIFNEFEDVAIPIIANYNGKLLLRVKPGKSSILASGIEPPFEMHLISFESENDFESFKQDDERKKFLHLKDEAISKVILIKGSAI